jgi:hypothetical protein
MHLFSNYLLILVLMVTWPVLLLLFLVFSAWLDRFAAQPPKWVVRRQQAAQARAEALNAGARPASGRTPYWHPPTSVQPPRAGSGQAGPAMAGRGAPRLAQVGSAPRPAQGPPQGPPQGRTRQAPSAAQPPPAGARPGPPAPGPGGQAPMRQGVVDESTEPMAGYPVDRLPPESAQTRRPERRRPPAGWTGTDPGVPSRVPAAWRDGLRP